MGANASTAVPLYASGQVLDAARLNLTNSGIPVFSGTATRDAAFGGSGEKVLAEGQFAYLEDTNAVQYYDGASFQSVGAASGLVCVKAQTSFATANSVNVNNVFSATYQNYRVHFMVTAKSDTSDFTLRLRVGGVDASGATDYRYAFMTRSSDGTSADDNSNGNSFMRIGFAPNPSLVPFAVQTFDIMNPFATQITTFAGAGPRGLSTTAFAHETFGGIYTPTTSFDGFTLICATGTMTGNFTVYGYGLTV